MKARICVLVAAVAAMWWMKHHYSTARPDDLWWILGPTAGLVEAMTGTTFVNEPGEGYFSRERLFLIEKSCAGVNFLIAAFGMSTFALGRRVQSVFTGAGVLGIGAVAGYAAALVVNAARITIAMWLAARPAAVSGLTAAQIHRVEGIAVYFGGLVLLYELVRWCDRRAAAIEHGA